MIVGGGKMLKPQDPCPQCKKPMDGVGWSVERHDCIAADAMFCPHPEFWTGARPYCREHGEPCQTPRAPFMQCVLQQGHESPFHLTAGGTQFTNSGKVGLGEVGSDFMPWKDHAGPAMLHTTLDPPEVNR